MRKDLVACLVTLGTAMSACAGTYSYVPTQAHVGPTVSSTRWSFVWGIFKDDVGVDHTPPTSCSTNPNGFECLKCHSNGVTNVTITTNVGFELLSLVTFGLVTPMTVSYQCAAPSPT